jgi:hypothetical protein
VNRPSIFPAGPLAALLAALLAACGSEPARGPSGAPVASGPAASAPPAPAADPPAAEVPAAEVPAAEVPAADPPGADLPDAVPVLAVKEADPALAPGTRVVVVGRIRQMADGVLTIVDDDTIDYCGRGEDCGCRTPWDYCCVAPKERVRASLTVELKDAEGRPVPQKRMDLRLLDLVALEGTVSRDPDGTLVVTTAGRWFRRERPALPADVRWPTE